MTARIRIDRLLVERGMFGSRTKAQAAVAAGLVTADDVIVREPAAKIANDAVLHALPPHPWVSRGGLKLAAALDRFGGNPLLGPSGRICLDVGASTGGFTEVLLARGAQLVYAVDVGRDQLHPTLRARADVIALESTDIRKLDPLQLPERPELVTVDTSFISLERVLPAALALSRARAGLLALIKPQFEAGKKHVKHGIVRDSHVHDAVCRKICALVTVLGWEVIGIAPSVITGGDGNQEFFIAAQRSDVRDQMSDDR